MSEITPYRPDIEYRETGHISPFSTKKRVVEDFDYFTLLQEDSSRDKFYEAVVASIKEIEEELDKL